MPDPVAVVGGGAAGLATARELGRRGIPYRVLERGHTPGQTWHDLYDSLRLHTGRHMSALPGLRMPRGTPLFPSRVDYHAYLVQYARHFGIGVETGRTVQRVRHVDGTWRIDADGEVIAARGVVIATGIVAAPRIPHIDGRDEFEAAGGTLMHSSSYRRPQPFANRRVLVVGVGNSGGEIGSELARAGVDVSIAVRSGANVVPATLGPVPIQYFAMLVRKLPKPLQARVLQRIRARLEKKHGPPVLPPSKLSPLEAIPLIGFHLVDEIRAGRVRVLPGITALTRNGARFTDGSEHPFDDVILATGFRPAIDIIDDVRRDARGFAMRADRVTYDGPPGLTFVGHNYDARGGLLNIRMDAPLAAARY